MLSRTLMTMSILAAGLTLPTAANAQAWDGFYVDGAIGARSSSTNATFTDTLISSYSYGPNYPYTQTSADVSKQDFGASNLLGEFSAGWRWAGPVVVGIGLFVDVAGNGAGKSSNSSTYVSAYPGGYFSSVYTSSLEVRQNSRYGISVDIAPNWRTHPYAKVAYAWSRYEVSSSGYPCNSGVFGSNSETLSGWGFGGGLRHLQTENLYFFAEVMWQNYGSKSTSTSPACGSQYYSPGNIQAQTLKIDPSNVVGVIGVGFKF